MQRVIETRRNWNLEKLIISAKGEINKQLLKNVMTVGLHQKTIDAMHSSIITDTCNVTKKYLDNNSKIWKIILKYCIVYLILG